MAQDVPPTEGQALEHLQGLIAAVEAGRAASICDFGPPGCSDSVEPFEPERVPTERPVLMSVRTVPAVDLGNGYWNRSYVRLELCGVDGLGQPYHAEMMVFWHDGRVVSQVPAYWLGFGIADDGLAGAPQPPVACPS